MKLFLTAFLVFAAGCTSALPPPASSAQADPVTPPGSWEMKVADDVVAPPPLPVQAHQGDQPNVASKAKRSLFTLTRKSQ
jgi:hypothetical protein